MINMHIVIPLQNKKQCQCQERGSVVRPEVMVPEWKYRGCTECSIITHNYRSLFPFRCVCACVRACMRASIYVWICSHPVNSRPGDVSWNRNLQMLIRFPVDGFIDGSRSTRTFRERKSSKCTPLESPLNMLTGIGTSVTPPPPPHPTPTHSLRSPSTGHTREEGGFHCYVQNY